MYKKAKIIFRKLFILSPLKGNFFILLFVLYISYLFYLKFAKTENEFMPILFAMCKIALILIIVVIVLSFLSVLISFLFYKYQLKNNQNNFQIKLNVALQKNANMGVHFNLQKIVIPFMGYIKAILHFDNNYFSPTLNVSSSALQNGFLLKNITANLPLQLADIKEYQIDYGYLFFEDMFRLFSLPISFDAKQTYQNLPQKNIQNNIDATPKKTNDLTIRIPQMRRIDGDLLHYKKFSTSDDTRRIVWKIFAKNRELVVRTPEIFNPFASNIYMYVSYHLGLKFVTTSIFTNAMLNYYKNAVFTIYDVLQKKDFEINYISDVQTIESNKVSEKITLSNWQTQTSLLQFIKPKLATVICLHSLNNSADVQQLCAELDSNTIIYFIKTSNIFNQNIFFKTFQRIFILPPKDELESIRSKWWLSASKAFVLKNEKEIETILQKQNFTFTIL